MNEKLPTLGELTAASRTSGIAGILNGTTKPYRAEEMKKPLKGIGRDAQLKKWSEDYQKCVQREADARAAGRPDPMPLRQKEAEAAQLVCAASSILDAKSNEDALAVRLKKFGMAKEYHTARTLLDNVCEKMLLSLPFEKRPLFCDNLQMTRIILEPLKTATEGAAHVYVSKSDMVDWVESAVEHICPLCMGTADEVRECAFRKCTHKMMMWDPTPPDDGRLYACEWKYYDFEKARKRGD